MVEAVSQHHKYVQHDQTPPKVLLILPTSQGSKTLKRAWEFTLGGLKEAFLVVAASHGTESWGRSQPMSYFPQICFLAAWYQALPSGFPDNCYRDLSPQQITTTTGSSCWREQNPTRASQSFLHTWPFASRRKIGRMIKAPFGSRIS